MAQRNGTTAAPGRWREWGLAAAALAPLALLFARPSIPQDPRFHGLADTRAFLGIPNFADVASNVVFLLVGSAGLALCCGRGTSGATRSWTVFFAGVGLVFFGSAWYHRSPDSAAL